MRITSKGQVTIPQDIREKAGLLPNTEVEFKIVKGRVILNALGKPIDLVALDSAEQLESVLTPFRFERLHLPWEAAFVAAKAFKRYRARGGVKSAPLPDFFIGAHAAVAGLTILTRDPRRYREYFPSVRLICPK